MPDSLTLTGSATYRERIALPPDAMLTVTLEDVSRADAPAVTLAQSTAPTSGRQAPLGFSLIYPAAAVRPEAVYAARARITVGERLLFTTTEQNRVDAAHPSPIELLLASAQPAEAPPPPGPPLTDTHWKLVEVRGQPIGVAEEFDEPSLVLSAQDSRLAGSGGVNRLIGGYTLAGDSLAFTQVGTTMMAGPPEAMRQEQAILAALADVRGFDIAGSDLSLLDASGAPVLKAVAAAPR